MTKTTIISKHSTNCNNSAIGNLPLLPTLRTKAQIDNYRTNKLHWGQIPRANNQNKPLQEKAVNLLSTIVYKLHKKESVILNHDYLSRITNCAKDQNVNLLKQLNDILDISFHAKISIDGKVSRNCYLIRHTEHGRAIIENKDILLAQRHFVGKVAVNPIQKSLEEPKKIPPCAEFFPSNYLYKEKKKKILKNRSIRSNFFEISLKEVSNENEAYKHKRKNSDYNHSNDNLINELQDYNTKAEPKHPDFNTENLCTKTKTNIFLEKEISDTSSLVTSDNTTINSENDNSVTCSKKQSLPKKIISFFKHQPKQLKDFHPLSLEDCRILQSSSGRDFTQVAMNEILLDMSRRLSENIEKEPYFYTKKGFMAYMTKAFRYEKRNAVQISSENFKIRNNESPDAIKEREQEEYLTKIEYSLETSAEWRFKKKLASVLERSKAYSFLTAFRSIIQSGTCIEIILTKPVHLSKLEREIVENQVRATHDKLGEDGSFELITEITITMPKSAPNKIGNPSNANNNVAERVGVWGEIRTAFAKAFGANGDAIDRNWMTKLEASVDEASKTINLKAPSDFIKNFIESRYLDTIEHIVKQIGFQLQPIECQKRGH